MISDFSVFLTPILIKIGGSRARERHDELRLEKSVRRDQTRASETPMANRIVHQTVKHFDLLLKVGLQKEN